MAEEEAFDDDVSVLYNILCYSAVFCINLYMFHQFFMYLFNINFMFYQNSYGIYTEKLGFNVF